MTKHSIRQVAEMLTLSKDTLRYYDKLQLVSPKREKNGYRYYIDEDIQNLMYIRVMKFAGFTLPEIKRILQNKENTLEVSQATEDTLSLLEKKKTENLKKIECLKQIIELLESSMSVVQSKNCINEVNNMANQIFSQIQNER